MTDAPPWYAAEGERGEQLLQQGRVGEATQVFEAILGGVGETPSYGRAVVLGRLGRCLHLSGQSLAALSRFREALEVTQRLPPGPGVRGLRGVVQCEVGDALRALGRPDEARTAYLGALRNAEQLADVRAQAVDLGQLGALELAQGRTDAALRRYRRALRLLEKLDEPQLEVATRSQLARVYLELGQWEEARALGEEALAVAQARDPTGPAVWRLYGLLAGVAERDARETQARDYRELERRGPEIAGALAALPDEPTQGRAVLLGQLGRCLAIGGRPDLALGLVAAALESLGTVAPSATASGLRGTLLSELASSLHAVGRHAEAREAYEASLEVAEEPEGAISVRDHVAIDYGFEPDLLVEGRRESRVAPWTGEPDLLAADLRPVVMPGARTWMEDDGAVWFGLPAGEPIVEPDPGCVILRQTRRDVAVKGSASLVWRLVGAMDGAGTVEEILGALPAPDREAAGRILAVLAETGAIDVSGRAVGRYLHAATKKGVLPAGGLGTDEVLRHATDMTYRGYPEARRVALGDAVPERLQALHGLTRARRSRREYADLPIAREQFEALLHTACGVTGAIDWAGRRLKLRAYPSSGGLYAVEIYPVAFRVDGVEPAVYHYRAGDHALETVRPGIDQRTFVSAALPMEREMVAATAAMVCLTGFFPRHEFKYGEGGYRMLVAEAGHISQNLVLAATALGLSARPFGGVFDDLLNKALGVDGEEEAFLLAVLVGHPGDTR